MKSTVIVLFFGLLFFSAPAMAYIDPGSGSAIMSVIVGFFVAIALVLKNYWYKIKSFFTGSKSSSASAKNSQTTEK